MQMNNSDIAVGIFISIFCILGFAKGVIRQFFSILAFILASVISLVIPYLVSLPVIEGTSPIWGYIILSILIWVPSFLIINSIGKFFSRRMTKKGIKFGDRLWGLVFGGIKGLIIVILIIFLLDILPDELMQSIPLIPRVFSESRIVSIVQPYNPLLKIHIMKNLEIVISSLGNPDYMELLRDDPGFQKLRQNESIRMILNDADLKRALEEGQFIKFITHPKVQMLIKDKEALRLLLTTDIDKAVISNI